MRASEIFGPRGSDVICKEGLVAVRAKLKGGKMRYAPMAPKLAAEIRRYPAVIGEIASYLPNPVRGVDVSERTEF